jgi:hypothetical protein
MIKKLVHPCGESVVPEIPFHILKDAREHTNVLWDVKPEEFIVIQKIVDEITFQPSVLFMINRSKRIPEFYQASIERLFECEAKYKESFLEKIREVSVFSLHPKNDLT